MSKSVIICPTCKGSAEQQYIENRETYVGTCKTCKGRRVVYQVITIQPLEDKKSDKIFNK